MAPAFALGVALLSIKRRRPAVQHVVFSIHFVSVVLLLTMVISYVLMVLALAWRTAGGPVTYAGVDQFKGLGMAIGTIAFLIPAYRRVYGDGKVAAVLKAIASFALFTAILIGYRLLLLYVTAYTL